MNQVVKDILTGIDGQSFAIVKVLGFAVVLVFILIEVAAFITGKPFDGQAYGIGAGAAIAAMGGAIKLSETSEPKP
ncbi:hypothetical protein [Solimicrobium silvestre]|uniref:Uncharacterized protein n=1 Tax=Solimicrobium silvestre TaxID=2099400 RepID=A0A2S9GY95_9BURK|nr:hypothetical protein [Solimicrobium silvestre]PRC92689.1 hypothetical protein S2091_2744 [Solimicrobium silvestre]